MDLKFGLKRSWQYARLFTHLLDAGSEDRLVLGEHNPDTVIRIHLATEYDFGELNWV